MACSTAARIFAQRSVEFGLSGGEIDTGQSFDRDELDARDTDIAQIGRCGEIGEQDFQARGAEGMGVVTGAVDRSRTDSGQSPVQRGSNLDIHPRIAGLG